MKIWESLVRNARFEPPTRLVSIPWLLSKDVVMAFCVAGVALRDILMCLKRSRTSFCVTSALPLKGSQKMSRILVASAARWTPLSSFCVAGATFETCHGSQKCLPGVSSQEYHAKSVSQDCLPGVSFQQCHVRSVSQECLSKGVMPRVSPKSVFSRVPFQECHAKSVSQECLPKNVFSRVSCQECLPRVSCQECLPRVSSQECLTKSVASGVSPKSVSQESLPKSVMPRVSPKSVFARVSSQESHVRCQE